MPDRPLPPAETANDILLSVVVPVLNEQDNVAPLIAEIRAALAHALGLSGHQALAFSVRNLGVTRLERVAADWRVAAVNDAPRLAVVDAFDFALPPSDRFASTFATSSALACSSLTTWICERLAGSTSTSSLLTMSRTAAWP